MLKKSITEPRDSRGAELTARLEQYEVRLTALLANVAELKEENHALREENQALKDEIARLKGHKGKPAIRPSQLNKKDKKKRNRNKHHRQKDKRPPDPIETVKAKKDVLSGSVFKVIAAQSHNE